MWRESFIGAFIVSSFKLLTALAETDTKDTLKILQLTNKNQAFYNRSLK
jgi:hypothetical protein